MTRLFLKSFHLKNFKAIRDSGKVRLTPLTVLIGNNGSGKSSLIEGLETLQSIALENLDLALQEWRGFEHILNQASNRKIKKSEGKVIARDDTVQKYDHPMSFSMDGQSHLGRFSATTVVNSGPAYNRIFIERENIAINERAFCKRASDGTITTSNNTAQLLLPKKQLNDDESVLKPVLGDYFSRIQFLSMVPQKMGQPTPQKRTGGAIRLARDASNVAQYLLDIYNQDKAVFTGILESLQVVLPYAVDLQLALTSEFERVVYLQLSESSFKIPGWLLSTGTLRVVALLALLRHPNPPSLIVIEEIENGLDPRTIHLIIQEMRQAVEAGTIQIIMTSHSPYLLDQLDLSQIVLVERQEGGPVFTRPSDNENLVEWVKRFNPGELYVMDRLGQPKERPQ